MEPNQHNKMQKALANMRPYLFALGLVCVSLAGAEVLIQLHDNGREYGRGRVSQGSHPCKEIAHACMDAGFVKGGAKLGLGLAKNCMHPILMGKTTVAETSKSLPVLAPELISQCKARSLKKL